MGVIRTGRKIHEALKAAGIECTAAVPDDDSYTFEVTGEDGESVTVEVKETEDD